MRAGTIVAGGRSTRFGDSDKAVADLAGTPMVRRVADRLGEAVDELVVNCREDQVEAIEAALSDHALDPAFALDEDPDRGPMAGIATGLGAVDSEYAAVVACDMPFVDPAFISYLFERATSREAAVPRPDEWYQTTQAVYHADAMGDACRRALERGEHKIVEPLFDLDYAIVEREEILEHTALETFENLNTRAEFEAAAERF